jgi:hypothetical protein
MKHPHVAAIVRERDAAAALVLPAALGDAAWASRRAAVLWACRPLVAAGSADDAAQVLACCWRRIGQMLGKPLPARGLARLPTLPDGWRVSETVDLTGGQVIVAGLVVTAESTDPVFLALARQASHLPGVR